MGQKAESEALVWDTRGN